MRRGLLSGRFSTGACAACGNAAGAMPKYTPTDRITSKAEPAWENRAIMVDPFQDAVPFTIHVSTGQGGLPAGRAKPQSNQKSANVQKETDGFSVEPRFDRRGTARRYSRAPSQK